jgi:hypothetical protein
MKETNKGKGREKKKKHRGNGGGFVSNGFFGGGISNRLLSVNFGIYMCQMTIFRGFIR